MDITQPYLLLVDKLELWIESFILVIPNIVSAALIFAIFYLVAIYARKGVWKVAGSIFESKTIVTLIGTVIFVLVLFLGFAVALSVLQLSKAVTSVLAGAGIVGIAVGFAFQDLIANLISGFVMAVRRPFRRGHIIETNGVFGVVKAINLRATIMHTNSGQEVFVPNKDIFQTVLTNYSSLGTRRIEIDCGVSYDDDLVQAQKLAIAAVKKLHSSDSKKDIECLYKEFGDSSINFTIRFWVPFKTQAEYLQTQSQAIIAIKQSFDKHNITIPFPIRTVYLNK